MRQSFDESGKACMELLARMDALGEPRPFPLELIKRALAPHDSKHMVDFYQDIAEDDRLCQMLCENILVEAKIVVLRLRVEEEQIGQPVLREEPFEIPHIGVADARRTALE